MLVKNSLVSQEDAKTALEYKNETIILNELYIPFVNQYKQTTRNSAGYDLGETKYFNVLYRDSEISGYSVSSSNENVCTVEIMPDNTFKIITQGVGESTVTVCYNDEDVKLNVEVNIRE